MTPYELRLEGHVDPSWFTGLVLTHDAAGTTTVRADVADQAALHGLLARVRDLGAVLISVARVTRGG